MDNDLLEGHWRHVLSFLPQDLELQASMTGALKRARGIGSAEKLLRMLLAYGLTTQPLKGVVAWAEAVEIASISAPAFFYRLKGSSSWLSQLLAQQLNESINASPGINGYRLRIVDATTVCSPGEKGTVWRVHMLADPASGKFVSVDITDQHTAESLKLHSVGQGDLVLADRVYARAGAIAATARTGADVLVRVDRTQIRLYDSNRQAVDWRSLTEHIPEAGAVEFVLQMPEPPSRSQWKSKKTWPIRLAQSWTPVRIVGIRPIKGQIVWILTTVPAKRLTAMRIIELYRLRWQIELLFKRLKSLLEFNELPAKKEPVVRAWILARLLAAALIQRLYYKEPALSPWGYRIRSVTKIGNELMACV